jgi:hypothetical protein
MSSNVHASGEPHASIDYENLAVVSQVEVCHRARQKRWKKFRYGHPALGQDAMDAWSPIAGSDVVDQHTNLDPAR